LNWISCAARGHVIPLNFKIIWEAFTAFLSHCKKRNTEVLSNVLNSTLWRSLYSTFVLLLQIFSHISRLSQAGISLAFSFIVQEFATRRRKVDYCIRALTRQREIVLLLRVKNVHTLVAIPRKEYLFIIWGKLSTSCKRCSQQRTFLSFLFCYIFKLSHTLIQSAYYFQFGQKNVLL